MSFLRSAQRRLNRSKIAAALLVTQLRESLQNEAQRLFVVTLVIGALCGLVAVLFHLAIDAAQRMVVDRMIDGRHERWWLGLALAPAIGGLVAGALLRWVVPGARGSGIPQVKKAFALDAGFVSARDTIGKFVLTTLQIGSGASLGREGPTVQICAGIASLVARIARLPPKNMRRLTPVGVAAGIAAAFNAPIAAVTFTIEEIVGALDHSVLSGVVVAAAIAAVIERGLLGTHPMIRVEQSYGLDHRSSLLVYALLGVAAAVVSVAFTDGLLAVRKRVRSRQSAAATVFSPAIGGLVTGALAVLSLAWMRLSITGSASNRALHDALAGGVAVQALAALCALKILATIASYSSGGAGGVFAPSLFIGAMLGGAIGHIDIALFSHSSRSLGSFALVGMGAVFAGVIRAPITSVLIIFEMTGAYGLVLPLMLANSTAYVLARRWRPVALYDALLAQDGVTLPHEAPSRPHALDQLSVRDAMTRSVVAAPTGALAAQVRALVADREFSELPVVDARRMVLGALFCRDLASLEDHSPIDAIIKPAHTIRADARLLAAVVQMNDAGVRHLFVIAPEGAALVGVLTITDVLRAHARHSARATDSARLAAVTVPSICARELAVDAPTLASDTRVDAALAAIERSSADACIVLDARGAPVGVVAFAHLREFVRDRELQRMLVVSEVMRPMIEVDADTTIDALLARFAAPEIEAALLSTQSPDARAPSGSLPMITRSMVAERALRHRASTTSEPG